jgi:hypothetical protein
VFDDLFSDPLWHAACLGERHEGQRELRARLVLRPRDPSTENPVAQAVESLG